MQTTFTATLAGKPFWFSMAHWLNDVIKVQVPPNDASNTHVSNIRALHAMARDFEHNQPNLAAELRHFATRSCYD